MGDKREAAVDLARRGFRVFKLQVNGKRPLNEGWTETATADPDRVFSMWTEAGSDEPGDWNIGVLTNEMIVVDVDDKTFVNKKGETVERKGTESFIALDLPFDTFLVRTAGGQSWHAYFTGPNRSLSADRLGSGLDIRSYHGYVVGPGSEIDGRFYEIENDTPPIAAPAHLIARLDAPQEKATRVTVELDTPSALASARHYLQHDAPEAIEGLNGNNTTFAVACAVKDMGLSEDTAFYLMVELYNERCAPPWELDELEGVVAHAYEYGKKAAGSDSAEAGFGDVDTEGLEAIVSRPDRPAAPAGDPWIKPGDPINMEEHSWLFFDMLPARGVACLSGQSGAGKTFLVLRLAHCLYRMEPFFGTTPDEPGATLILYGGTEGSGFVPRVRALDDEHDLPIWGRAIKPLNQQNALQKLYEEIEAAKRRILEQYGIPVRLIVLETLSASGLLQDENDNVAAAQAVAHLKTLSDLTQTLVVFTHHPPKGGKGSRGAGALHDNADVRMEATRGDGGVRELALAKGRNSAERVLGNYTLLPVTLPIKDAYGRPITTRVISMTDQAVRSADSEPHKQWPILAECIDVELVEPVVLGDGRKVVREDQVRALFFDRYAGAKDSAGKTRLWKRLIGSVNGRFIDVIRDGERTYLAYLFQEDEDE